MPMRADITAAVSYNFNESDQLRVVGRHFVRAKLLTV